MVINSDKTFIFLETFADICLVWQNFCKFGLFWLIVQTFLQIFVAMLGAIWPVKILAYENANMNGNVGYPSIDSKNMFANANKQKATSCFIICFELVFGDL